ncbi:hypothetical protein BC941DRAFT_440301 [Chlamydoabsidia padenii]|nr:hypothetical protein BC941DRAFT_440301 [Chlamydoabsidia padenii]
MNNHRQIPLELLRLVMTHVTDNNDLLQCTLVNKHFYAAANPRLWHSPVYEKAPHKYTPIRVLKCLQLDNSCPHLHPVHLGTYVRNVSFTNICNSGGDSSYDLLSLLKWTPKVEEITLEGNGITDLDMNNIVRLCPKITTLTLLNMDNITNDVFRLFDHLTSVTLKNCNRLSNRALMNIKNPPHVTTLILVSMNKITDDSLREFNHLTSLTLEKCSRLTSRVLLSVKHCPLISLCLDYAPISYNLIGTLFGQTLCSLSLSAHAYCQLTMPPIQGCCLLKEIRLDGFGSNKTPANGVSLRHYVEAYPQLEQLELSRCKLKPELEIWNLNKLRRLYLDCKWGKGNGRALPIVWLKNIIVTCPRLIYIKLTGSIRLTWDQDYINKIRLEKSSSLQ